MSFLSTLARGGMGFLGGGPAGAALAVGSALFNKRGGGGRGGGDGDEAYYGNRFRDAVAGLGSRSASLEDDYLSELDAFDPEAAFSAKTTADLDAYDDDFGRKYASQVAHQVGEGRSPVTNGFGLRDVQQTIRQGMQDRARIRTQNSDSLARMRMERLGMMGSYASGSRDLYMNAVGGRLNTLEGDRMQDTASKRGLVGSLLGAAATGVGAYYGGRR